MLTKRCPLFLAAFLLALLAPAAARADFVVTVTPTVTPPGAPGGLYLYEYLLANDPASDQAVFLFDLQVSTAADLRSITGPAGWDVLYLAAFGSVTWASFDAALDVQPGASASFSFLSPLGPAEQPFTVIGANFDVGGQAPGPAAAPSGAVPAPPGAALAAAGLLSLALARSRRLLRRCARR